VLNAWRQLNKEMRAYVSDNVYDPSDALVALQRLLSLCLVTTLHVSVLLPQSNQESVV
jgi:hypothetical protein